jgi:hypothetical protein
MSVLPWKQTSLIDRIRWLRYLLPPALVVVVVIYQLGAGAQLWASHTLWGRDRFL